MRRPLGWLATGALLLGVTAGCGDDDDAPSDDTVENQPEVDGGDTPDDPVVSADDGGTGGTTGGGTAGNVEPDTGEQGTTQSTAQSGAG